MNRSSLVRSALALVALTLAVVPAAVGHAQSIDIGNSLVDRADFTPRLIACPHPFNQVPWYIGQADIDANKPYVINQSGTYCVTEDLEVSYTTDRNSTIVIAANDVTLLFRGYRLSELNGSGRGTTAIFVAAGYHDIRISGGALHGFTTGIYADGWWVLRRITLTGVTEYRLERPVVGLYVTAMSFELMDVGVALALARSSTIERNSFADIIIGMSLYGDVTGTEVRDNEFALGTGRFAAGGWFQYGIYGSPAYAAVIRDNTITGNPQLPFGDLQQYGIVLFNGSATTPLKGHNLVEGNHLYRVNTPITLFGSGRASNNVVRSNQIYGESAWTLYTGPLTGSNTAVRVDNNEAVTVNDNVIYSGPDVGYQRGIHLQNGTTVTTQPNGQPGVYDNMTCGVDIDLDPLSADGGNLWDACGLPS